MARTLYRFASGAQPLGSAQALSDRVEEAIAPLAVAIDEVADNRWAVVVYLEASDDKAAVEALLQAMAASAGGRLSRVDPEEDWVARGLRALSPVRAGRFLVHGAHDRAAVRPGQIPIEIEAAQAFGTGHHATTLGCLLALEWLNQRVRPAHVLDLGTGSGVLAIAAAKLWQARVTATDIDPIAVDAARENGRANGVAPYVRFVRAEGFKAPALRDLPRQDLILANILARPLIELMPEIANAVAPGGRVVLSGLLKSQAPLVVGAAASRGLALERRFDRSEWATLLLARS